VKGKRAMDRNRVKERERERRTFGEGILVDRNSPL
jgi:hypothetical protein